MARIPTGPRPSQMAGVIGGAASRMEAREARLAQEQLQRDQMALQSQQRMDANALKLQEMEQQSQMGAMSLQMKQNQAMAMREQKRQEFEHEKARTNIEVAAKYGAGIQTEIGKDGRPIYKVTDLGKGTEEERKAQKKKEDESLARDQIIQNLAPELAQKDPQWVAGIKSSSKTKQDLQEALIERKETEAQMDRNLQTWIPSMNTTWPQFTNSRVVDPELQKELTRQATEMAKDPEMTWSKFNAWVVQTRNTTELNRAWEIQGGRVPDATPEEESWAEHVIGMRAGGFTDAHKARFLWTQNVADMFNPPELNRLDKNLKTLNTKLETLRKGYATKERTAEIKATEREISGLEEEMDAVRADSKKKIDKLSEHLFQTEEKEEPAKEEPKPEPDAPEIDGLPDAHAKKAKVDAASIRTQLKTLSPEGQNKLIADLTKTSQGKDPNARYYEAVLHYLQEGDVEEEDDGEGVESGPPEKAVQGGDDMVGEPF